MNQIAFSSKASTKPSLKLLLLGGLLFLCACAPIRLLSVYDAQTDQSVTALQKKVDGFLVGVIAQDGLPECAYSNYKSSYQGFDVDATSIRVRAAAITQNEITVAQVDEVKSIISNLQKLHRSQEAGYVAKQVSSPCVPVEALSIARDRTNSAFTKILELELAKRRGDK